MNRAFAKRLTWRSLSDGQRAVLALVTLLLVYGILVFGVLPRHVFFSGDEGMKYVVTASVARRGDLWHVAYEYPGREIDPEMRFFPFEWWMWVRKGEPVPKYLSVLTFLNAPLYGLFGVSGLYVMPLVSGVVIAWLGYRLSRLMEMPQPWIVPLLIGLCTPVFFYSLTTWDHMPSVLLSTLVVYLMARQVQRSRWWEMALAGVIMGLGLWTRYEMFLFVGVAVLAYLYVFRGDWKRWRGLVPFVLGLVVVVALMLAQQRAVYGELNSDIVWLRTSTVANAQQGAHSVLDAVRNLLLHQAEVVLAMSVDGSAYWVERVFLAVAFAATVVVNRLGKLQRNPLLTMGSALMLVIGTALAFIHPRLNTVTGLVPTLPLSALGIVYPPPSPQEKGSSRRKSLDLVMTVNVGFLFLGLFLVPYTPGYSWGPRYLAPLFPLLGVLAWVTVQRSVSMHDAERRRAICVAFGALACLSLVVQCIGVGLLYDKKQDMLGWYDGTLALDTEYVLSDQGWYLQEMAGLHFKKRLFQTKTQEDYEVLVDRLYQNRVRRFAWIRSVLTEIDPLIQTPAFFVQKVDETVHEIVKVD